MPQLYIMKSHVMRNLMSCVNISNSSYIHAHAKINLIGVISTKNSTIFIMINNFKPQQNRFKHLYLNNPRKVSQSSRCSKMISTTSTTNLYTLNIPIENGVQNQRSLGSVSRLWWSFGSNKGKF